MLHIEFFAMFTVLYPAYKKVLLDKQLLPSIPRKRGSCGKMNRRDVWQSNESFGIQYCTSTVSTALTIFNITV